MDGSISVFVHSCGHALVLLLFVVRMDVFVDTGFVVRWVYLYISCVQILVVWVRLVVLNLSSFGEIPFSWILDVGDQGAFA